MTNGNLKIGYNDMSIIFYINNSNKRKEVNMMKNYLTKAEEQKWYKVLNEMFTETKNTLFNVGYKEVYDNKYIITNLLKFLEFNFFNFIPWISN